MTEFSCFNQISCIIIIILQIGLYKCVESNGYCAKDSSECSGTAKENKYTENSYSNHILSKISSTLKSHKECQFFNCSCYLSVLRTDLKPFRYGITKKMVDDVRPNGVTYIIYENSLYRGKDCMFPSRCSGVEYFIKQLLPKLKNMEFILNTRDWPQINRHFPLFGPVFSFSKTDDYYDIMYPAWSFWEGGPAIKTHPTGLGRWDLHRKSLTNEFIKWPWHKKKSIGLELIESMNNKRWNKLSIENY